MRMPMVAERGLAERHAVVEQRPDHRDRPVDEEQEPAEAEREQPEHQDEDREQNERHRDDDDVDEERHDAPLQHALEQLGRRRRIIGVRLEVDAHADSRSAVGHRPCSFACP